TARVACLTAVGLLTGFALLGQLMFKILGVTLPAFQLAGGLVLLLVALDMLRAQRSPVQETAEETAEGREKDDIAITPLAMPMLAGPGAILTVILLAAQAASWAYPAVVLSCVALGGLGKHAILGPCAT